MGASCDSRSRHTMRIRRLAMAPIGAQSLAFSARADLVQPKSLAARSRGFVHNHSAGDPTPSQADIQMTKAIINIATPLGIAVHDHIIVGRGGHASLKGMRLI